MTIAIARTLDVKGLACPLPIVKTAQAIKLMAAGELIEVVATDPGSVKDFQAFSKQTGNELLSQAENNKEFEFFIKRK